MCMASELSSDLQDIINIIRKTGDVLKLELSQSDKTICDLQHEIEFGKFDVFKGYNKLKQLQETLQIRRSIKNEWELFQPLITYVDNIEKNVDKIHTKIIARESQLKNRKYAPRILKDMGVINKGVITHER